MTFDEWFKLLLPEPGERFNVREVEVACRLAWEAGRKSVQEEREKDLKMEMYCA